MAVTSKKKKEKHWISRLRFKYRLVILNDETFEEKISFRLSRLNVFVALGALSIILVIITIYIIAFTPLKEYIPGYASVASQNAIYDLQIKADSLAEAMQDKDLYILNIKNIIEGKEIVDELPARQDSQSSKEFREYRPSREDSLLRAEMEDQSRYSLSSSEVISAGVSRQDISGFLFFTPLKGVVTNSFDPINRHYGIDIVSKPNEPVKTTLDGTVIFSDWTIETGYTIGVQHQQNLFSVYRHNASLLKKAGSYVKAGEPIAIFGGSGEMSTGPHLHFELWYNGSAINPKDYMAF